MRSSFKGRIVLFGLVLQCIIIATLLVALDSATETVLRLAREQRLQAEAEDGFAGLEHRVDRLRADVTAARTRAQFGQERHLPNLQSLKELAGLFKLQVRRVERKVGPGQGTSTSGVYSVSLVGKALDEVPFLHRLEQEYVLDAEQVALLRADETGEAVMLTMVMRLDQR